MGKCSVRLPKRGGRMVRLLYQAIREGSGFLLFPEDKKGKRYSDCSAFSVDNQMRPGTSEL